VAVDVAAGNACPLIAGICVSTDVVGASEVLRKTAKAILRNHSINRLRVHEVSDVQQLAAGCDFLLSKGCNGVVALGVLLKDNWAAGHLASAVTQALGQLGSAAKKPVIPGIVFADSEDAAEQLAEKIAKKGAVGLSKILKPEEKSAVKLTSDSKRAADTAKALSSGTAGDSGLPQTTMQLLQQLRSSFGAHGARSISGISRKFRVMDDDGSGDLCLEEFKKALKEHVLGWTDEQIAEVFEWFDEDKSGAISYDEFLFGLKGEMNDRRAQLVLQAFALLDKDKSGTVEVNDIQAAYNAKQHPDVIAGKKTENQVLREFLDTFDCGEKDGKVSPAEFCKYYSQVSASIDDDDYFELMIRNAWHISGGEGVCANTTCRRVLVTHSDGRQTVEEIKNDLGVDPTDTDAMMKNLQAQGLSDVDGMERFGNLDTTSPATKAAPSLGSKKSSAASASTGVDSMAQRLAGTSFDETPLPRRRQAPGGQSTFTFG
jgi:Ca2+-binding EF-hand superfamily protein/riboflavin synthase